MGMEVAHAQGGLTGTTDNQTTFSFTQIGLVVWMRADDEVQLRRLFKQCTKPFLFKQRTRLLPVRTYGMQFSDQDSRAVNARSDFVANIINALAQDFKVRQ